MEAKEKKGIPSWIAIIIIMAVVIPLVVVIYRYVYQSEEIVIPANIINRNNNKTIQDLGQIINYQDADHGFSLEVPSQWSVSDRIYRKTNERDNLVGASGGEVDDKIDLRITFYNNDDSSLAMWVSKHKLVLEQESKATYQQIYQQKIDQKERIVNQQEVFILYLNNPMIDPVTNKVVKNNYYTQAYLEKDGKVYEIKFIEVTEGDKKYSEVIDTIIGSFRFIEPEKIADWEKYRNDKFGYELKFPSNWEMSSERNEGRDVYITNQEDNNQKIVISIEINDNPNNLSLWDWAETQNWPTPGSARENFVEVKISEDIIALKDSIDTVYFLKEADVFSIENGNSMVRKVVEESLYNLILSTFKFDETVTSQISGEVMYATKFGKEVTVVKEDLISGTETELLKYQERLASDFGGNYYSSIPPSIDLSKDKKVLAYENEDELRLYHLDSQENELKLYKTSEPSNTDFPPPTWSYKELPERTIWGFYGISTPLWSFDDKFIRLVLGHNEGLSNGVYNVSENTLDILRGENPDTGFIGRDSTHWANNSNKIIVGADGFAYSDSGFFLGEEGNYYQAKNLASTFGKAESWFYDSAWAQDDSKIAFVVGDPEKELDPNSYILAIANPDGLGYKEIITHSVEERAPLFYKNSEIYYYIDSHDDSQDGIWKVNVDGSGSLLVIKDNNSILRPVEWFNDRYLVYLAICKNTCGQDKFYIQINIYDRQDDKVVYQGEVSKNRLTFLDLTIQ